MLAAMRDLPPLSVLASRFAVLIMVAAFFAACSGSVAPAAVPSTRTLTPPPAVAPPATRASGTVKIHDGNSESEGNANNPKVCTFHLHFFFGAGTSGTWRIDAHPGGSPVMNGTWSSGGAEDVRVPEAPDLFSLPDGQYKLYWTQDGANGQKQKVFKVECAAPTAAPVPTPAPTAAPTASPLPTAAPTATPTPAPTASPAATPAPTAAPTASSTAPPTQGPAATPAPTAAPTASPTAPPTLRPTASPAPKPTPTPRPTGGVGSETDGTETPAPGGGTAPDTATEPTAAAGTDADARSNRAPVLLLIAGLAGLLLAQRRFAAGR
jgi:hypothetical protein